MEKKLSKYEVFNNYGLDPIPNFELFHAHTFKGWEAKQVTLTDIENIIENTTTIFFKFNISAFSEQDKKLLYKDCKSEIIKIKEHLKKQSNFNEKKFLSIKKKYREILGLMYEIESFVAEDEILEYLELESDYEEMFNEIERKILNYSESTTIKSFVEQLESSEKEFEIGMNFKRNFPTTAANREHDDDLDKSWFKVSLKFVDGTVYDLKQKYPSKGVPLTRAIFANKKDDLSDKEFDKLIKNYRHLINGTLGNGERNLFKEDEESKHRWLKVIKYYKIKPSQFFIDDFIRVYGYDPTE